MIAILLHHKIGKANIRCIYGGFFSEKCLSKPWKFYIFSNPRKASGFWVV
jgi:hypothetical protein